MATLEEKQAYYEYGPMGAGGWVYKEPPTLDPSVEREVASIGEDRFGDPRYRFLWAGVAVVRELDPHATPIVRGNREATKYVRHRVPAHLAADESDPRYQDYIRGRLQPKYLAGKVKEKRDLCWRTRRNKVVRVKREGEVPKGKVAYWELNFVDLGRPRWVLEIKLSPEELVEAGIYLGDDPAMPARGEYVHHLTVQTPEGLYYEPDEEYFAYMRKFLYEAENVPVAELRTRSLELSALLRERQAEELAQGRARIVERILSHALGRSVEHLFGDPTEQPAPIRY